MSRTHAMGRIIGSEYLRTTTAATSRKNRMSKLSDALDELTPQMRNRGWFDLTTPDPAMNSRYSIHPEDKLPGRPTEGKIKIARFFERLQFFSLDEELLGYNDDMRGSRIFEYLKAHNLPVLGPNVGEFLHKNQHLIPTELQGKVSFVFWGQIYRGHIRFVRALTWFAPHKKWVWSQFWIDGKGWRKNYCVVLLKE